jgi:hypothetical protein
MKNTPPPMKPFLMTREEAPSYWLVDSLWSVLASAETTGGALTVLDQDMPRRSGRHPTCTNGSTSTSTCSTERSDFSSATS